MFGLGLVELLFLLALMGVPVLIVAGAFAATRRVDEPLGEVDLARELYTSGAWRDGRLLVMREGAVLPDRCVKTNLPARGKRLQWTVYWHHPAIYLVLLANLILYIVVALLVRKKATVRVGISEAFLRRRRLAATAGWVLAPGGFALAVFAGTYESGLFIAVGFLMFLMGLTWAAIGTRVVSARRIEGDYVWLSGAAPEFLALLPAWGDRRVG